IVFSIHPRTYDKIKIFSISINPENIICAHPFGFCEFIALEKSALCVLTDSGTVQEECAILGILNVTIRETMERPETMECGSNLVSGLNEKNILSCVKAAIQLDTKWFSPMEYRAPAVSNTV